jgi:hypothetical protein
MTLFNPCRSVQQWTIWWIFGILAALSNVAWGAAGYVHEMSGDVHVQNGTAAERVAKMGDIFDPGATFRTGADGKVVIKFEDGQIVTLQPNTAFRVEGYSFNANNPKAGNSALRLLRGAMRFVTGIIGSTNHNNVNLAAGTATIGIRGTDVNVLVDQTTQAVLAMIAAGTVVLETPGGTTAIGVGQYASYVQGTVPTAAPLASAPASARAIVNALQATPIPVNTPVIVASAAAAATAVATARQAQAAAAANPNNAAAQTAAANAVAAANALIQTAVQQAQTALQTAISNGAVQVTAPATPTQPQTVVPPAVAAQAAAAAAAVAAPANVQQINTIIAPPVTPPPVKCTGSPC